MPISISILLSYLLLIGLVRAQLGAPDCTNSTFTWSYNSLQQNPCLVTAYLAAVCNNGVFNVPKLTAGNSYTGPSGADNGDQCKCNTVVYNLISACDACQGELWLPYSTWSFNCTTKATPGTFPEPVPTGTRVPKWAYIDSSIGNNWNISEAQLLGVSPTSTSHSSKAGAIAGGVIGGVIGAALIAWVVVWSSIRRRRARSSPYLDFQGGEKEQPPTHPPKIYDPSDPSTYPSKEYLPRANQLGFTYLQRSDGGYSGLPEI